MRRLAAGTYDNELLDAHFIAGDGRVNENIALTAVHHIFHSEHNRQIERDQGDGARRRTIPHSSRRGWSPAPTSATASRL